MIGIVAGVLLLLCMACGIFAMINAPDTDPTGQAEPTATAAATPVEPAESTSTPARPAPTTDPTPTASPEPKIITMPNLVGKNAAVADDQLRKLGFTNIQFGSADREDTVVIWLPNWTVTKQSTKAGAKVPADTLIVLTCTKKA